MKIRVYQINSDRDEHRVMFLSHDRLERFQGNPEVNSSIYDKVYDKDVPCGNLEEVYTMLNSNHPSDYRGRSLSVSDIVEDSLEAMQRIVGGDIEEFMPYVDEVAIICNEEGKMNGLPPNRAIYFEPEGAGSREMVDIIFGTFFICYAPAESEKFLSLPKELAQKYETKFKLPERFFRQGDKIIAVPYEPHRQKHGKEHER